MSPVDLIRRKRDGRELTREEIEAFVEGVARGTWSDGQVAALLMAILLRGMTDEETACLTDAMARSGARLAWEGLATAPVDKHSTGGVGDKTSLVVAPLVAACGVPVPMLSGRALGHTGGTLDKLEAIPGFRVELSAAELRRVVAEVGCAFFGQTEAIAPADRRLYALRDLTATIESVPLIVASIMSKKIAAGIAALVLDVKVGRGAFMKTDADARALAAALVAAGARTGVKTEAILTSMDAPLGRAVGNALEVVEALDTLRGRGPEDVVALALALGSRMLVLAGAAPTLEAAERRVRGALDSGAGLEVFRRVVERQGGDPRVVDRPERLPLAPDRAVVTAPRGGVVAAIDAERVGYAALRLGAGRDRAGGAVDPGVGVWLHARVGDAVRAGEPIVELRHRGGRGLDEALGLVRGAVVIADAPPPPAPLVRGVVTAATIAPVVRASGRSPAGAAS
jgi:pyrimidine-nucleoside phosphorylase